MRGSQRLRPSKHPLSASAAAGCVPGPGRAAPKPARAWHAPIKLPRRLKSEASSQTPSLPSPCRGPHSSKFPGRNKPATQGRIDRARRGRGFPHPRPRPPSDPRGRPRGRNRVDKETRNWELLLWEPRARLLRAAGVRGELGRGFPLGGLCAEPRRGRAETGARRGRGRARRERARGGAGRCQRIPRSHRFYA